MYGFDGTKAAVGDKVYISTRIGLKGPYEIAKITPSGQVTVNGQRFTGYGRSIGGDGYGGGLYLKPDTPEARAERLETVRRLTRERLHRELNMAHDASVTECLKRARYLVEVAEGYLKQWPEAE